MDTQVKEVYLKPLPLVSNFLAEPFTPIALWERSKIERRLQRHASRDIGTSKRVENWKELQNIHSYVVRKLRQEIRYAASVTDLDRIMSKAKGHDLDMDRMSHRDFCDTRGELRSDYLNRLEALRPKPVAVKGQFVRVQAKGTVRLFPINVVQDAVAQGLLVQDGDVFRPRKEVHV